MISTSDVRELANEHRFSTANLEKVFRLVDLLAEIYSHPFLKDCLVLKGGTAINVFLFDVPRLSVDIDFNYIGSADKDTMLQERNTIREIFDRIFKVAKYQSTPSKNYGSDRYNLWYRNVSGNRDQIKVETNFLLRVPLMKPVKSRQKKLFGVLPLPSVKILAQEDLFATKIIALLARHAARDLYDIDKLYQLKRTDIKRSILKACAIFYGVINREDFRKMSTDAIALITERDIKRTLWPLLRGNSEFDLKKAQTRVHRFVSPLLKLTSTERQFVDSFFAGQYTPALLFKSKIFNNGLAAHPMVQWKISHILKHRESSEQGV